MLKPHLFARNNLHREELKILIVIFQSKHDLTGFV